MDLSPDTFLAVMHGLGDSAALLMLAILLATFILEDAATVAAALLAVEGLVPHSGALAALYAGIIIGDIGLYGLGALAARWQRARTFVTEHRMLRGRAFLEGSLFATLFSARCTPGMRTPTFTASGFLGIDFGRYVIYVVVVATVWATALYALIVLLGQTVWDDLGPWRWALAAGVILGAIVLPRLVARVLGERQAGHVTPTDPPATG